MKKTILFFLLAITGFCYAQMNPIFKIISYLELKPLKNHKIVLYNGDIIFKLGNGANPYPYNYKTAKTEPWFLDELKTDDKGLLTFNKKYDCHSIILVIGEQYENINFSFSNNLSHNYSGNHIRIVDFVPGDTQVRGNYIYNLKNKEVAYFKINGDKTVKKFRFIKILAIKKKVINPKEKGIQRVKKDIAAGEMKILYYGKPWSQDKPLVDEKTGLPIKLVAGCCITPDFREEIDAYNAVMRQKVKSIHN